MINSAARSLSLWLLLTLPVWAKPYAAQGCHFQISKDLVPAKMNFLDSSDWLWPSLSQPQVGLLLHRVKPDKLGPEEALLRQKTVFFSTADPAASKRQLGKWSVGSQKLKNGTTLETCLVPLQQGWLFIGLTVWPGREARAQEIWRELQASLRD